MTLWTIAHCPTCGAKSDVVDSRPTRSSIRRRRKCSKCDRRWSTFETALEDAPEMRRDLHLIAMRLAKLAEQCADEAKRIDLLLTDMRDTDDRPTNNGADAEVR